MKDDFLSLRVNEKVTVGVAYRTTAAKDFLLREGGNICGVRHSTAVTVCIVVSEV
jgi:hypothetical protein